MAIAWPSGLQQLLNTDGFAEQLGTVAIRSENDVGPAKVRARSTKAVDNITCSINVNATEMAIMKSFFRVDLGQGVMPFEFNHPLTQDLETYRFVSPPSFKPIGSGGIEFACSMEWERI